MYRQLMGTVRETATGGKGEETPQKRLTVDEPEKCTRSNTASDEGEERGDENGGPDWNAATEVSAAAHRVDEIR